MIIDNGDGRPSVSAEHRADTLDASRHSHEAGHIDIEPQGVDMASVLRTIDLETRAPADKPTATKKKPKTTPTLPPDHHGGERKEATVGVGHGASPVGEATKRKDSFWRRLWARLRGNRR